MGLKAKLIAATTTVGIKIAQIHGVQDKKIKPFGQKRPTDLFNKPNIGYQHHMVA
jgi:hypothetical protein